ncbi:5-hydroxytryptamine receptor 3A-like [Odontesthes bonariensis]|uniref:5-hydroxytryptamine receptor 3A-like n=1 Tax=Odontesthes bonariensis TaxID=219752 RepID=UPI003F58EC9E
MTHFLTVMLIQMQAFSPCNSAILNCSQPDAPSHLRALQSVFNLSSIRPVRNMSTPTTVSIHFTLFGILGVDEKAQVLTTFIWENLEWRNEFSVWDPDKCGSEWIAVPRELLWVPDIVINEFMEKNTAPFVPYTYLHFKGWVFDEKPVRVVSSCSLDIYLFPFDTQNCTFTFNSYIHYEKDIQLELIGSSDEILQRSKEVMSTMGEWSLVGITAKKYSLPASFGEYYQELRFFISVRRHSTMYVMNLLVPSCFLITVDLFSFILPPQNIDRSIFKMTLVLGYTVFLLSTNDLLPITGNTIPLINVFLSLCLALMVASLLETIFVTNLMTGSTHYDPAPRWIRDFFLHVLGPLVRLPPKPKQQEDIVIQNHDAQEMKESSPKAKGTEISEQKKPLNEEKTLQVLKNLNMDLQAIHLHVVQQLKGSSSSAEWVQIGAITDRLLFILYILFISVSFITLMIIWASLYSKS